MLLILSSFQWYLKCPYRHIILEDTSDRPRTLPLKVLADITHHHYKILGSNLVCGFLKHRGTIPFFCVFFIFFFIYKCCCKHLLTISKVLETLEHPFQSYGAFCPCTFTYLYSKLEETRTGEAYGEGIFSAS